MKYTLNNIKIADLIYKNTSFYDKIPLSFFRRILKDVLVSDEMIIINLSGSLIDNKKIIKLKIVGSIPLVCQRCLNLVNFDLKINKSFLIVGSENDPYKEYANEALQIDQEFKVSNFVEDEIILSLPFSPKHEEEAC